MQVRIDGEDDKKFLWCRTCWRCIKEREQLADEAAARTWIAQHKPDYQRKCVAREQYEAAKEHQLKFFSNMSGKEKYKARNVME